jgi:CubicO group peptidase (beta-lactamase class C family)
LTFGSGNLFGEETNVNQLFQPIIEHLQSEIARGTFPSAQFVIGQRGRLVTEGALGHAVLEPEKIPATKDTLYDLASLTKPLVTALLAVLFAERGWLDLSAPAGDYLEELRGTNKRAITLMQLLTHTSGLQAWRPLYLEAQSRNAVVKAIAGLPLDHSNDTKSAPVALYSDLNFILLGFILERLTDERLDKTAQRELFTPLGLRRTMFNPPSDWKGEIAATELGQTHERETVAGMKFVCPLPEPTDESHRQSARRPLRRKALLWGEVHDGNAWFMEGVSGHAGLFSTAREVFTIARQFTRDSKLLKAESLALFTRNFTNGVGEARSAGWLLAATKDCSAGPSMPKEAFGHNGFTGTSVWIAAASERIFVLLTNRVHPRVKDLGMKQARQQFHRLAIEALNQ